MTLAATRGRRPLLLEAFHGRETKLGPEHPHTIDSLRGLVRDFTSFTTM